MARNILLTIFSLLLAGATSAHAGVMVELSEGGSKDVASINVASMSAIVAALAETEGSPHWMSKNGNNSMSGLTAQSSVFTAISGVAIAAVIDNVVPTPKVEFRLLLRNSAHPPSPDLDGLIKPPQVCG